MRGLFNSSFQGAAVLHGSIGNAFASMPASPSIAEIAAVNPPLITVAMSVYNGARYLPEQLDSVLAQRGVELELVAVDDGSTDDSVVVLRDYAGRDRRIQVHLNPSNLGPTRSFERAMSLGHGELIAPCDQDDRWHPDKLAILLAALGPRDLAYCNSRYIDECGRATGRCVADDLTMMAGLRPLSFVFANSISGHAALLRRSLFDVIHPLPAELYYDWTLAMFAAARQGIVYVDRPLVEFRRHPQAFSSLGQRSGNRMTSRQRRWFRDRQRLVCVLAESAFDSDGGAARLSQALALATNEQSRWPLLRAIWRERERISPDGEGAALQALRLQARLLRKLRRARKEPALDPNAELPRLPA